MSRPDAAASLAGGGSAAHAAQVFRRMDNDNNGGLDTSEMLQALQELGVLDGVKASEVTRVLQKELREADEDHNGLIDLQEFQRYFQKLAVCQQTEARSQRLKSARKAVPTGAERNPALRACFRTFCQYGKSHIIGAGSFTNVSQEELRMNPRQFLRLCKEAGILKPAGSMEPFTADVIFAQCRLAGDRSMDYKGFLEALGMLADAAGLGFEDLVASLSEVGREGNASAASLNKSSSKKSMQRPSIVAKLWKRPPSTDGQSEGSHTARSMERRDDGSSPESSVTRHDLQRLVKAKNEALKVAAAKWAEEKLELQKHILQLQGIIEQLQADTPMEAQRDRRVDQSGQSLQFSLKKDLEDWKHAAMTAIQDRMNSFQADCREPASRESTSVNKLRLQIVQLEDVVSHMAETQASFVSNTTGFSTSTETAPAADLEEAVQALEERALERQARLEAAVIQVAMKVDMLEKKISALKNDL